MAKPIVAIVGRPNVGKSTLFNKLTGQRLAIVEDTPGVTRDRIFCDCEWCGHKFLLVDTGGIEPVVLAVNKCDKVGEPPMELYDFYSLGIGDIVPISSVHGHGTGDLLDTVCENLHFDDNDEEEEDRIPVAVIGRPNVGKSSLINHILGENLYRYRRSAQARQGGKRCGALQCAAQPGCCGTQPRVRYHD